MSSGSTDEGEIDVIAPQPVSGKRKSFMVPMDNNNLADDAKCVARIRIQALSKSGVPIQGAQDESEEFWIENGEETIASPPDRGQRICHLDEIRFRSTPQVWQEVRGPRSGLGCEEGQRLQPSLDEQRSRRPGPQPAAHRIGAERP